MKLITLTVLTLLSTTAFAEDWQHIPDTSSVFVDRDSIARNGEVVYSVQYVLERGRSQPSAKAITVYDCARQRFAVSDPADWHPVKLGSDSEKVSRALCTRSTKF